MKNRPTFRTTVLRGLISTLVRNVGLFFNKLHRLCRNILVSTLASWTYTLHQRYDAFHNCVTFTPCTRGATVNDLISFDMLRSCFTLHDDRVTVRRCVLCNPVMFPKNYGQLYLHDNDTETVIVALSVKKNKASKYIRMFCDLLIIVCA